MEYELNELNELNSSMVDGSNGVEEVKKTIISLLELSEDEKTQINNINTTKDLSLLLNEPNNYFSVKNVKAFQELQELIDLMGEYTLLDKNEKARFVELFSKFTKVPKRDLTKFLETNDFSNLLKRPQSFTTDPNQIKKIVEINELRQHMNIGLQTSKEKITSPGSIYNHLIKFADYTDKEYFLATFLDTQNQIIKTDIINIGLHNASLVNVKDVSKRAILCDSANVIVSHNHPSGNTTPSNQDIQITKKIYGALKFIDVNLLDHIILGENNYLSLKEEGFMDDMKSIESLLSERVEEKEIYERTEVNKIDHAKGTVHIYQLNDNPDKCFIGKKEDNKIKQLGSVAAIETVKKEFKEFKEFEKEHSKTSSKDKIKTEELSI